MREQPTPREVKALRLEAAREAKKGVRIYLHDRRYLWDQMRLRHGPWVRSEVRLIRNLILRDLDQLAYELRHGIGRRMTKKKRRTR